PGREGGREGWIRRPRAGGKVRHGAAPPGGVAARRRAGRAGLVPVPLTICSAVREGEAPAEPAAPQRGALPARQETRPPGVRQLAKSFQFDWRTAAPPDITEAPRKHPVHAVLRGRGFRGVTVSAGLPVGAGRDPFLFPTSRQLPAVPLR